MFAADGEACVAEVTEVAEETVSQEERRNEDERSFYKHEGHEGYEDHEEPVRLRSFVPPVKTVLSVLSVAS